MKTQSIFYAMGVCFALFACAEKKQKTQEKITKIEIYGKNEENKVFANWLIMRKDSVDDPAEHKYRFGKEKAGIGPFYGAHWQIGNKWSKRYTYIPADAKEMKITLKDDSVSFEGAYAKENNVLVALDTLLDNEDSNIGKMDEQRMFSYLDSLQNVASTFLDKQEGLDKNFVKLVQSGLKYKFAALKFSYPFERAATLNDSNYKPSEVFFGSFINLPFTDEALLCFDFYTNYIDQVLKRESGEDDKKYLQALDEKLKGKVRFEMLSKYLLDMDYNGIDSLMKATYDKYIATYQNAKQSVKDAYKRKEKIMIGKVAPDFTGATPDGKKVSLSDFKGKLVYIDFWATWCVPCIAEFPYLKTLEHFYHKNKDIVFMSVSIDVDQAAEKWKTMVKEKSLGGVQIRVGKDQIKDYGISAIPTFILVSKDGKIIAPQAPRPSEYKKIKKLIDANL